MSFLKRLFGQGEVAPEQPTGSPDDADDGLLINAYATVRELPLMDFPHELLGRRDRSDPELAPHLGGFIGYAMGLGDGQMTATRYHLWRHLQRVRNHVSFVAVDAGLPAVEAWARQANAVFFLPDGSVRAPDMATIISVDGESDPDAALPYQPDAVARRERTLARLSGIKPTPPASMPPAIGEAEVVLRPAAEVLQRALALYFVAATAQGRDNGPPDLTAWKREDNPIGFTALTPREKAFVDDDGSGDFNVSGLTWRYEAAGTLLWALGVDAARIEDSDVQIDVDALWDAVVDRASDPNALAQARLRPTSEILDVLDRTWREHWIVRQAGPAGVDEISGDIIMERHHALNWLTGFQNEADASWDDIDTPT